MKSIIPLALLGGASLTVLAGPGDGIQFDKLTLHPFLESTAVYDSNIGLTQRSNLEAAPIEGDEEDDLYFQLRYGLNLDYQRDTSALAGTVYGYNRYYQDFDLDNSGLGQTLNFNTGSKERLAIGLSESYSQLQDYSAQPSTLASDEIVGNLLAEDLTDRLERDILGVGLSLSRQLSAKMDLGGGFNYGMTDYDDEGLFDSSSQTFSANVGWGVTAKSSAFVSGSYGLEDSDSLEDDGESRSFLVGMRSTATQKINYNVGVGYIQYVADGLESIDTDGLNYSLGIGWHISEKLGLQASASKSISASSFAANNAREIESLQVGVSHHTTDAVNLGAAFSLRQDDFVNPIVAPEGAVSEERLTYAVNLTANYAPPGRWYRIFGAVGFEDSGSEINGEDYDQLRVSGGVNVLY